MVYESLRTRTINLWLGGGYEALLEERCADVLIACWLVLCWCREFCGHGVGRVFHTSPNILHFKYVRFTWLGHMPYVIGERAGHFFV